MKRYLKGNHDLHDEKNRNMQLSYYLVEDTRDKEENRSLYSIQITKKRDHGGWMETEEDITPALSDSKEMVERMIEKLVKGVVTPVSLIEIVDDMFGENLGFI